ncbi:MAG: hypothetical protein Q7S69_08150 [Nitrosomonadaceae bacterium]|nr:hypothetical protein [Nitrosomonadaceae bacterium]
MANPDKLQSSTAAGETADSIAQLRILDHPHIPSQRNQTHAEIR